MLIFKLYSYVIFGLSVQLIFTAQCTLVQSTVLRSHVIRPPVTLVDCDHIGWTAWKLIARTIRPAPSVFVAER